ncbi:MAG TPA: type II toxin-antitoxin system RelE/ParE family toxin [Blastocatellia bacterium]
MIQAIQDRRIRAKIIETIDGLAEEPEKKGKALIAELDGYHSVRAAGQRYRIIYRIDKEKIIVLVVATGIRKDGDRKDIYELAKKLIRARLLEPGSPPKGRRPEDAESEDAT